MNHSHALTRTTTSLLCALNEPGNEEAWHEFVDRCTPIMRGVASQMGVREEDLEDVVQTTLVSFLESWRRGQYDRSRGRLSAFLVTILRSRVIDMRRRRNRERAHVLGNLDSDADVADPQALEHLWEDERRHQVLLKALEELRDTGVEARTIEAFDLYAVRGMAITEVAARLGMTPRLVYRSKYRVSRRLRSIIARVDEMYEDL